MKFQRGDLVDVVGKMDGKPWPHARGLVTGFFFGPTTDLIDVTDLQSELKTMPCLLYTLVASDELTRV